MVNWNSRTISKGQIIRSNLTVLKVTEKGNVRTFLVEMSLPDGFKSEPFKITAPVDSQDIPVEQANGE